MNASELQALLDQKRAAYHADSGSLTSDQQHARTVEIKALMAQLSDSLAPGAKPCPKCGAKAHGSACVPEHRKGSEIVDAEYSVRCCYCKPVEIERTAEWRKLRMPMACGDSPEEAVERWNAGRYWVKREAL